MRQAGDDAGVPAPQQEPPPTRRGGRWRTLGRVLLRGVAALSLVLALGLLLLHTGPGRHAVQAFVEKAVGDAAGGELKLGSLDYRLWAGWASAGDARLTLEGARLEIGEAQARWSPRGGLRLRLVRPVVLVRDSGRPLPVQHAVGLAARPWTALEHVAAAELVAARFELQDARGVAYLVLGDVSASLAQRGARRTLRLALRDGLVGPPQGRLGPVTGDGSLALDDGRLVLEAAHLDAGGSTLDLEGALDRLSPTEGTLRLRADVDGALAARAAPAAELGGRVRAQASLTARDTLIGTLRLSSPALTVQGSGPWDVSLRGRFDSSRLVIEWSEALGYGGRVGVEGRLALAGGAQTDLQLKAEALDVAALAGALAKRDVPIRSLLRASLRYTLRGSDLDLGRAEGELALAPAPARPRRHGVPGLPVEGAARLRAEGRRLRLEGLRLEAHGVLLAGELSVSPALGVEGRYRASLPLASLPALLAGLGVQPPRSPLVGSLQAEGEIGGQAKDPFATLRLRGAGIASGAGAANASAAIEGSARYAQGRLVVAPLIVSSSGGGRATFTGRVPLFAAGGAYDLDGVVDSLELEPLLVLAGLGGRGPLNGRVRIEGARDRPAARAELDARLSLAGGAEPISLSLAGSGSGERLAVERFDAAFAAGRVHGAGAYDLRTRALAGSATAEGLRLAQLPLLPASAKGLDGVIGASASLGGTADAPSGELRAWLEQASVDGSPVPGLRLAGRSDGRRLELSGGMPGDAGATFLRGSGSLDGDWPLRVEIDAAALPLQEYLEAFPATRRQNARAKAQGRLAIDVPLRDLHALRYRGEGLIASGQLRGLSWSTQEFRVDGDAWEARLHDLRLATTSQVPGSREQAAAEPAAAAGTLAVAGRLPIAPDRRFDLTLRGGLDLAALRALFPEQLLAGQARLDLHVGGTAADPELRGELSIDEGRGRYGTLWVTDANASVRLEGERARVQRLEAGALGGRITAAGSLPLRRLGAGQTARLHFDVADLDLLRVQDGELASSARDPDAPALFLSLAGDVEASAPRLEAIRAGGRLTRLEEQSQEGSVSLAEPAEWTLADGRFVQSPLRLTGAGGTLEARAEVLFGGAAPSGSVTVVGPLDLRTLSPFVPDTTLAGPARIDVRATWDPQGVRMTGGITLEAGRMTLEQLAFTASQVRGELRLLGDRATIDATATAGDGRLVASGGMRFGPQLVGPGELRLEAQRVPISYPEGFRARATGTIRVAGDAGSYTVGGEIGLSQAYYTAEFDRRKQSLDRLDWQLAALRGGQSISESLPLAVQVRLDDPLRIRNSQAQLDISGTLAAGGTLAQPVTTGQLTLLEGGQLTLRRARIRVQQGRVELNGYPAGNPEVDLAGLTQVSGTGMEVRASGTLDDLQLQISSANRPDLSQTDLVSLLLTGRTAQAAAADSGAIVAEELASALGGVLQKGVGETLLVDVAPDQSLLTSDTNPTQRFSVGTRLRQDLTVLYSVRLDGAEQRWSLDWNPRGGRLRLRAISEADQGAAFEATDRVSVNLLGGRATAKPKQDAVKVVAVTLQGELPLPPQLLLKAAGLKAGNRYDALRIEQAADRVRERLARGGWRAAAVDATWAVAWGQKRSVEVVLRVESGPLLRISWTGDDPGRKIREQAKDAWPAYASAESASAAVARAARVALRAQGYYDAKVEHRVRLAGGHAELELDVARGPKGTGIDVRFEGNEALPAQALLDTLPKPGSKAFFEALEGRGDRITGEARLAYAKIGYLQARVGPPRQSLDARTGRLRVSLPVRERRASRVSELLLPPEMLEAGSEGPKLTLKAGEPFDVTRYLADRDAIAAWYRASGWTEARLRGVLAPTGQDVVVRYEAAAGPRPRVNEVRVATDGRPKQRLLRRSVALDPGELITPRQLARSRERLSELQIFRSVDVRPESVEGRDDLRDVVVSYVERPDVDLEYGVRYSAAGTPGVGGAPSTPDNGRIQLAAAAAISDPLGWGWRVRPYTYLMSNRYTYGVGLESASFFGLRLRTLLQLFDDRDARSDVSSLASRVRGWSAEQSRALLRDTSSRRWHDRLRLQWGYANKDVRYTPLDAGEILLGGNRAYASLALIGDERDSLTDPHRGVFWTAASELSRRAFGSEVDYVRFYGQVFAYLPLPLNLVWAQGYRAGVVPGTNPLLLLESRFQAGGPTTVRGFSQNDLGPRTREGDGLGGQGVIVLNQELRFPIWRQLGGGVFWDAGNAWALSRDVSLGDLRQSVGAGLRIMFPFGPIRLEYAWILSPRPGERTGRFVFGLGHAF